MPELTLPAANANKCRNPSPLLRRVLVNKHKETGFRLVIITSRVATMELIALALAREWKVPCALRGRELHSSAALVSGLMR